METSLQNAHIATDGLSTSTIGETEEALAEEQEGHIHMPNPSLWPFILTVAIILTVGGLIFWNHTTTPWLSIIAAPFILVGILGWALEDPMAVSHKEGSHGYFATTYAEAAETGKPTVLAEEVLQQASEVVDRIVTIDTTPRSAHPVKVELEREGVILALYGKVELEAQRKELENALLHLPGVIDVKNFVISEDTILNTANERIEKMRAAGKLEGAKNISVLVENYILNLYGEVPVIDMKYALERELIGIPGVKVVVNRIGLADIPGHLGRTRNKIGN
jgi:osmotically-inducible protein OsmY